MAPLLRHEGRMRLFAALAAFVLLAAPAQAQTADPLLSAVDAYGQFQDDVSALADADITTHDALDFALERTARHDPARLTRGWIAYGALTAAQSPAFVAGVRSRVRAANRAAVLRQLRRDLTYARRRPPGASEAIQLVLNANAADVARMNIVAARYDGIGNGLNASTWAARPESGDERNGRLRTMGHEQRGVDVAFAARLHPAPLSAAPLTDPDSFGGRRFWDAVAGRASTATPAQTLQVANTALMDRVLTLAALYILSASAQEPARVTEVMDDPRTRECLEIEQLQFRQCASVAHDPNEDAFCLARHGLAEPSQCFARLAQ